MYRIAICDDSSEDGARMQNIVQQAFEGEDVYVAVFKSGEEMLRRFSVLAFDVIVMDVMLDGENGIDVCKHAYDESRNVQIIFISSSDEFMYMSYTVPHLWYIKKADIDTLLPDALARAAENLAQCVSERVEIRSNGVSTLVAASDILYVEQKSRKVNIITKNGTLTQYGKASDFTGVCRCFVQCHKSYVINTNEAVAFTRTKARMSNGTEVPISRACYPKIREWLLRSSAEKK